MNTVAILMLVSASWFGGANATELMRFHDAAKCREAQTTFEATLIVLENRRRDIRYVCIEGVIVR